MFSKSLQSEFERMFDVHCNAVTNTHNTKVKDKYQNKRKENSQIEFSVVLEKEKSKEAN